MLEQTTVAKIIDSIVKQDVEITDNSILGKCSCCGECCTNFLPICQEEFDVIQEYVIKNNIKPQMQMLVMQNRLSCPYHDGKKCLIYEVRPLICREFYCYKKPTFETGKKFQSKKYITVNMWAIAKDIEKMRLSKKNK